MRIEPLTRIVRSPGPVETTIGSEIVLMDAQSGLCFGLGDTGSAVWRLLGAPITPADAVSQLSQEYDAPPDLIQADILELLENLYDRQLIQIC